MSDVIQSHGKNTSLVKFGIILCCCNSGRIYCDSRSSDEVNMVNTVVDFTETRQQDMRDSMQWKILGFTYPHAEVEVL